MRKSKNGFTLFEVLVSMFITGAALLGLALMDVYILKSSQASFNYTVATIKANSFIDSVWLDLCNAQSSATSTYATIRSDWVDELTELNMTAASDSPPTTYTQETSVAISWTDSRFTDDAENNSVTMSVKFPSSGCE
jgi:type IV pilus assembly protein PilV